MYSSHSTSWSAKRHRAHETTHHLTKICSSVGPCKMFNLFCLLESCGRHDNTFYLSYYRSSTAFRKPGHTILSLFIGHSILPVFDRFVCIAVQWIVSKLRSHTVASPTTNDNLQGAVCCVGVMGVGSRYLQMMRFNMKMSKISLQDSSVRYAYWCVERWSPILVCVVMWILNSRGKQFISAL